MRNSEGRVFDHVVIIMFENEYRSYVMENRYMRDLAARGIDMGNYFGVMHKSHSNYLASIAGEICNTTEDPQYYELEQGAPQGTPPPSLANRTLPDLIAESSAGVSWKAYMESYFRISFPPTTSLIGTDGKPYPAKPGDQVDLDDVDMAASAKHSIIDYVPYMNMHNPFVRFKNILENRDQWERIDNFYGFLRDVVTDSLPEYCWLTPDLWSDGHYLSGSFDEMADQRGPVLVDQLATWLQTFFSVLRFPGPRSLLPPGTLVVVTFDESDFLSDYTASTYDGPNQIYTVLLGDVVEPYAGTVEEEGYNHYSLLKTIEKNFGLGDLGKNDAGANWFRFLWGQQFQWGPPQETPISTAPGVLAAAGFEGALYTVYGDDGGSLLYRTLYSGIWSDAQPVPAQASAVALAACGNELILVCQADDRLSALTYDLGAGWSGPRQIVAEAVGSFAVTAFVDPGDQLEKLMLAYQTSEGIQSMILTGGEWGDPVAVGFSTAGDVVLAVIGPSLYLIYQAEGSDEMNVVSYNTAGFNVLTVESSDENDTTRDTWSPVEFPVSYFSRAPDPGTPHEAEPLLRPYQGGAPLAAASLDGVIHLAHPGAGHSQVLTETFSLAGIMTPKTATGNGWGTLAEAGWSRQTAVHGVHAVAGGAMSMCRFGSQLALLFEAHGGPDVGMSLGEYC